jgi:hypothetical protein
VVGAIESTKIFLADRVRSMQSQNFIQHIPYLVFHCQYVGG